MKISELIDIQLINLDLKAKNKDRVIQELAEILDQDNRLFDINDFMLDIKEREALGSTGMGFKIAIPHAKSKSVKTPSLAFGKSERGIEYDSLDGDPAELFFMIAMPEEGSNTHLQVLALLSRNLIHEDFRDQLHQAKTPEEILDILKTIDKN